MSSLRITSRTQLYALIGDPVEHSLSPSMQNAAFEAIGLDGVYVAFRIEPHLLQRAIEGFRAIRLSGLNVTMPHKIAVMKHLDEVDSSALTIGAVNTIVNSDKRLIGYNTDGAGALAALREGGFNPEWRRILILGAGGAARALAFSLAPLAAKVVLLNRTSSKAIRLSREVRQATGAAVEGKRLTEKTLAKEMALADLLINATSVGMYPKTEESLVSPTLLQPDLTVFDIVYNPLQTRLLRDAREVGARTVCGLMMLVYQGATAFELWTSRKAPVQAMIQALKGDLELG